MPHTLSNIPKQLPALLAAVWLAACAPGALRAQEIPFYEQTPFDRITLDEANDNEVLLVQPLDFPERRVPADMRADASIVIRLVDRPDKKYEVVWHSIDKIELFEDLVLAKADELIAAGKLDDAYAHLVFLMQQKHPPAGLDKSWQELLFADAKIAYRQKQYDRALAMLRQLHERDPSRAGLDTVLGATTDRLVEKYLARESYASVRQLIRQLAEQYPEHPVATARRAALVQSASEALEKARQAGRGEDWAEAARWCRRATLIWPSLPGLRQTAEAVHRRYPRLVIGVGLPADQPDPARLADPAARRSGRLLYRTLTEYAGPGVDGGHYDCPVGELAIDLLEHNLVLDIRPDIRFAPGDAPLGAYDVSRMFLEMASPGQGLFRPEWSGLLATVAVTGPLQVEARLARTHVRPDALLVNVFVGKDAGTGGPPDPNGPYRLASRDAGDVVYRAADDYFDASEGQPQEIVERRFDDSAKALRALRRGEVDVVERVPAWRLKSVENDDNLVLGAYAVPRVHCLIPNLRKLPTSNRTFRRALVYGIHRQAILDRLSGNGAISGCCVLSGPFPAGVAATDPLGYACDPNIEPRPYDPRMAIALGGAGLEEAKADTEETPATGQPLRLVLAHPPGEIARIACIDIRRQLKLIGLAVDLRELEAGVPRQIPDDVDLMYVELALWEPLLDARRLLGDQGPAGRVNPFIRLALRRLDEATDWQTVHARLRHIHRLAHDDVSVVPLWQLRDHFAHRKALQGVGSEPAGLYQHVEKWRPGFEYPSDEP